MIRVTNNTTSESAAFDLLRVDFSPEAVATEHPVELGVDVTDHVQVRPLRFTAQAFVTSSPLGPNPAPFAIEEAVGFFERQLGQLLTVVIDGEGTFSSMVLEGFAHGRDNRQGRPFDLRFKYVRVASAVSVAIPPRAPAPVAAAGAPTEQALGQQSTTPGTPTSALYQIRGAALSPFTSAADLVGGLFGGG
jgi:hypothetical protein